MIPGTSPDFDAILPFVCGDTWAGIPTITFLPAPTDDVASATFYIKNQGLGTNPLVELTSAGGGVSIISASNWIFTISPLKLPLKVGKYACGFRTVDINGIELTYMAGTLEVLSGFTNPPPP